MSRPPRKRKPEPSLRDNEFEPVNKVGRQDKQLGVKGTVNQNRVTKGISTMLLPGSEDDCTPPPSPPPAPAAPAIVIDDEYLFLQEIALRRVLAPKSFLEKGSLKELLAMANLACTINPSEFKAKSVFSSFSVDNGGFLRSTSSTSSPFLTPLPPTGPTSTPNARLVRVPLLTAPLTGPSSDALPSVRFVADPRPPAPAIGPSMTTPAASNLSTATPSATTFGEIPLKTSQESKNLLQQWPGITLAEWQQLASLREVLIKIDQLVGMENIKDSLARMVAYLIQHRSDNEMLNLCIYAGPGMGKTTLASLLAELYYQLGLLKPTPQNKKEKYLKGTRATMIAQYLGQTTIKTQNLIDRCVKEGKVLLIDEAYQLGNPEKRDIYSKEVMDCLNQNLSEQAGKFFVIMAGYEEEIQTCFFSYNAGLRRRFGFSYTIEEYKPQELRRILLQKITQSGWSLVNPSIVATNEWFLKNKKHWKYSGGDMETLFVNVKMAQSTRVLGLHEFFKRKVSQEDLEAGLALLLKGRSEKAQAGSMMSESVKKMYI